MKFTLLTLATTLIYFGTCLPCVARGGVDRSDLPHHQLVSDQYGEKRVLLANSTEYLNRPFSAMLHRTLADELSEFGREYMRIHALVMSPTVVRRYAFTDLVLEKEIGFEWASADFRMRSATTVARAVAIVRPLAPLVDFHRPAYPKKGEIKYSISQDGGYYEYAIFHCTDKGAVYRIEQGAGL